MLVWSESSFNAQELDRHGIIFFSSPTESLKDPLLQFEIEPFSYFRRRLSCLIQFEK